MALNNIRTLMKTPLNKRGDFLIVNLNESSGRQYVDLRRWYTDDDDDLKPTQKGVSIPMDEVANVSDVLAAFVKETLTPTPAKSAAPVKKTTRKATR
jgi:hypothetical protein